MAISQRDDGLLIDVHSAAELADALDALHSHVVDNLEGDPLFGQCAALLESAETELRFLLNPDE